VIVSRAPAARKFGRDHLTSRPPVFAKPASGYARGLGRAQRGRLCVQQEAADGPREDLDRSEGRDA
jgi:hypothetical protein